MIDAPPPSMPPINRLRAVMAALRDPDGGCPWDLEQTFATIAPYTIEEAYEVAEAANADDMDALRSELGDLLLQTVFHAQIAEDRAAFTFDDICTAITEKMIRRHPHVFTSAAAASSDAVTESWESIKAEERGGTGVSALEGVAAALPGLLRAQKLQKRAARSGFDWTDAAQVLEKVAEETRELAEAETREDRADEAGDLLFAVVNALRHSGIDAEAAMRRANAKFERRFRAMEDSAGGPAAFAELDLDAQEALWGQVKSAE